MTARIRTAYSFRHAVGVIPDVISRLSAIGATVAPITDRASTFGFHRWSRAAKKAGLRPVYGVELAVVRSLGEKRPTADHWTFFAIDSLTGVNDLVRTATNQFHYQPLLTYTQAMNAPGVIRMTGHRPRIDWEDPEAVAALIEADVKIPLAPSTSRVLVRNAIKHGLDLIATSDNYYPTEADFELYEVATGRFKNEQVYPQHILSDEEWRDACAHIVDDPAILDAALAARDHLLDCSRADLSIAELPHITPEKTLRQLCVEGAAELGVDLGDLVYTERLDRELALIEAKKFGTYFHIVSDLVQWARKRMIVGPARGSSCGSLVCYLLRITTVDPIPHGLIFERFIDVNRDDLPDIDIDFSDKQRHLVFEYMSQKYGADRVARLGTVANFKGAAALQEAGMSLRIPKWMTDPVGDALIVRQAGDDGALDTLRDTLATTPAGEKLMTKHPEIAIAARMEGHPRHYSQHAAGVVLAERPIADYVAIDARTGATMCDKVDAEAGFGLLKIDALGLIQLSIFEDALEMCGLPRDHLESLPLDDQDAFNVLNARRWNGIFQFNGGALQSLTASAVVDRFEDIVNITALARPGALNSGGAADWAARKVGKQAVRYPHPLFEPYLAETLGVVTYQEQVMAIARDIGDMSWAEVTALRKGMSKSMGPTFFAKYGDAFKKGALAKGIPEATVDKVWSDLCAFGAWAFNKSHSVAYGMVSYWCCWFKAHHPFEFAAATLNHAKDTSKMIAILSEMKREGYDYIPVDPERSGRKWSTTWVDGKRVLLGPLSMINGIGPKTIEQILGARARGERLTQRAQKLLLRPTTPIDSLTPIADRIKKLMPDPTERNIFTIPTPIGDITEEHTNDITPLIIGVVKTINRRDENDPAKVATRGFEYTRGPTTSLSMQFEDDTGTIYTKIGRFDFDRMAPQILDRGRPEKAIYAVKGKAMAGRRFLMIEAIRYIGDMEDGK